MKPPLKQGSPDDFQTPPIALKPLLPFLKKEWTLWEPAEGKGYLTKYLQEQGYNVIGTDIKNGFDFFTYRPDEFDCVVTNPPYTLKQQFLERLYKIGKPFALLLPLTTFETEKRQALFREYGVEVILFPKRINFETPNGVVSHSWFCVAWFTNGLNIGKQLTFVNL